MRSYVLRKALLKIPHICEEGSQLRHHQLFCPYKKEQKVTHYIHSQTYLQIILGPQKQHSSEFIILRKFPTSYPLLECNTCLFHITELINSYDSLFGIILVSQNQTIKSAMAQTKHEEQAPIP